VNVVACKSPGETENMFNADEKMLTAWHFLLQLLCCLLSLAYRKAFVLAN
jgi:hypothetical protein